MASLRQPSKVYTGLAEPILIGGAEPQLLRLNVGLLVFIVIVFKTFWWVPVTWLLHQAIKSLSKDDPFIRGIYMTYQAQADRYEPYPEKSPKRRNRPLKFGRGVVG